MFAFETFLPISSATVPDAAVIVVTNPVDPLVTRLQQRTCLDRRRILGYTVNDSLRLRTGLAHALGVARPPENVTIVEVYPRTGAPAVASPTK